MSTSPSSQLAAHAAESAARSQARLAALIARRAPVLPSTAPTLAEQKGTPDWRAEVQVTRFSVQSLSCGQRKLATCGCACSCHNGPFHCGSRTHMTKG